MVTNAKNDQGKHPATPGPGPGPAHAPAHAPAHGPAHGPTPGPTGAGAAAHGAKPTQRRPIADDEPEAPPAKSSGHWEISLTISKVILLVVLLLISLGAAIMGTLYYAETRDRTALMTKISRAIDTHTEVHRHDGHSFQEVTLVDSIRHCITDTLLPLDFIAKHGLKNASSDLIIAEAEKHCLNAMITEVAKNEVIAQEKLRQAIDITGKERDVEKQDELLHFIITFAKMKGYALPDEFKVFKTDLSILNRFMDAPSVKPVDDRMSRSWQH